MSRGDLKWSREQSLQTAAKVRAGTDIHAPLRALHGRVPLFTVLGEGEEETVENK